MPAAAVVVVMVLAALAVVVAVVAAEDTGAVASGCHGLALFAIVRGAAAACTASTEQAELTNSEPAARAAGSFICGSRRTRHERAMNCVATVNSAALRSNSWNHSRFDVLKRLH